MLEPLSPGGASKHVEEAQLPRGLPLPQSCHGPSCRRTEAGPSAVAVQWCWLPVCREVSNVRSPPPGIPLGGQASHFPFRKGQSMRPGKLRGTGRSRFQPGLVSLAVAGTLACPSPAGHGGDSVKPALLTVARTPAALTCYTWACTPGRVLLRSFPHHPVPRCLQGSADWGGGGDPDKFTQHRGWNDSLAGRALPCTRPTQV